MRDKGIVDWLGLKVPNNVDTIPNPKKVVSDAFYRKTGRQYQQRRSRAQLVAHATGVAVAGSPSWNHALALLSPCLGSLAEPESDTLAPKDGMPRRPHALKRERYDVEQMPAGKEATGGGGKKIGKNPAPAGKGVLGR